MSRKDSARAALARVPFLHPSSYDDVIRELTKEGILDEPRGNSGGAVHAAREVITGLQAISANAVQKGAEARRWNRRAST
jgi:hypothetical protein